MSERICVAVDIANIEWLILEGGWMFSHECVVLVVVGERHEDLQKRLSRNEAAELSEAELIRLIYMQLGTPGSKRIDPRGHKTDGSSIGVWYYC